MPLFSYQATNHKGEIVKGELDAPDEATIIAHLQSQRLIPIKVSKGASLSLPFLSGRKRVKASMLSIFTMELSTLLGAGLPLDRSLNILIGMEENPEWKRILESLAEQVKSGKNLSDAMREHDHVFGRFYISLIHAGEVSGALNVVLERLSDHQEKQMELRGAIRKALTYPVLLIVFGIGMVLYLLFNVVPKFEGLVSRKNIELPFISDVIFGASRLLRHNALWVGIGVAVVIVLVFLIIRNPNNRASIHRRMLKFPLIGGLIRKVELANSSRTLGTMLTHGVPLVTALKSVKDSINNSHLRGVMDTATSSLKGGRGMAKVLIESREFPMLGVQMIKVGEETGKLEEMLLKVANIYDKEVRSTIDGLLAILEPVILMLIAGVVAVIMAGVLLAIMSISSI